MQPDIAQKMTDLMKEIYKNALSELKVSMRQGLAIKEYQLQGNACHALEISLSILNTLNGDLNEYCSLDPVNHSLELIHKRYEDKWSVLPKNKCLNKLMVGTGFIAVDMALYKEAELLFNTLALLGPDNVHPLLGLAYTKINKGSAQDALVVIRDRVLTNAPDNDLGIAFMSLTYQALNMPEEALAAASAVIAANRDKSAVCLAREVQIGIGPYANYNNYDKRR